MFQLALAIDSIARAFYQGIFAASTIADLPGLLSAFLRKRICNLLWISRTRFSKDTPIMRLLFDCHSNAQKHSALCLIYLVKLHVTIFHCYDPFDISTDQRTCEPNTEFHC